MITCFEPEAFYISFWRFPLTIVVAETPYLIYTARPFESATELK